MVLSLGRSGGQPGGQEAGREAAGRPVGQAAGRSGQAGGREILPICRPRGLFFGMPPGLPPGVGGQRGLLRARIGIDFPGKITQGTRKSRHDRDLRS